MMPPKKAAILAVSVDDKWLILIRPMNFLIDNQYEMRIIQE
jgi:hypothetical protein